MKLRREPIDTSEQDEYSQIGSWVGYRISNEIKASKVSDLEGEIGPKHQTSKANFSFIKTDTDTIFITIDFI